MGQKSVQWPRSNSICHYWLCRHSHGQLSNLSPLVSPVPYKSPAALQTQHPHVGGISSSYQRWPDFLPHGAKELLELFCLQPNAIGWRQNSSSSVFASDTTRGGPGGCQGGPMPPKILPAPPVAPQKFCRSLSESPTQTMDSSPCCKTVPSSVPPKWKCLAPPLDTTFRYFQKF